MRFARLLIGPFVVVLAVVIPFWSYAVWQAGCHLQWVDTHNLISEWDYVCVRDGQVFERAWVYHQSSGMWRVDYREGFRILTSHSYMSLEEGKASIERAFK